MGMKIKVASATTLQLDWLVAKCEGYVEQGEYGEPECIEGELHLYYLGTTLNAEYCPSTDWAKGGPIIEREVISFTQFKDGEVDPDEVGMWCASYDRYDLGGAGSSVGTTLLIATMRCYIVSQLGEEVEITDDLPSHC